MTEGQQQLPDPQWWAYGRDEITAVSERSASST
jgi:hypothetical protein